MCISNAFSHIHIYFSCTRTFFIWIFPMCIYAFYMFPIFYIHVLHIYRSCFASFLSSLQLCVPPETMPSKRELYVQEVTEKLLRDLSALLQHSGLSYFPSQDTWGLQHGTLGKVTQSNSDLQWWGQVLPLPTYQKSKSDRMGSTIMGNGNGNGKGEYKHSNWEKFPKSFCYSLPHQLRITV